MSRRRRVVAPPTRLGASEEGDLTDLAPRRHTPQPAPEPSARPAPSTAADRPTIPDRAREDTDEAWGEGPGSDEHLLRERPPHWS